MHSFYHLRPIALLLCGALLGYSITACLLLAPSVIQSDVAADDVVRVIEGDDGITISLLTANEFHSRLLLKVSDPISKGNELHIEYGGILRDEGGQRGFRVEGNLGNVCEWSLVSETSVVCTIKVSRNDQGSIAKCKVASGFLYISVSFVDGANAVTMESLDAVRPELGGRSIREALQLLKDD